MSDRGYLTATEARQLISVRAWTMLDLYSLVCAYAELTDGSLDMKGARVRITIKKRALPKKAKKVSKP